MMIHQKKVKGKNKIQMKNELVRKYNVPGPRYTSYPTVPLWSKIAPHPTDWNLHVKSMFDSSNTDHGISLYIHLPYCESLCTYCGCTTRITVNHNVERPYIKTVLKEWDLYLEVFGGQPMISELHLGGGTPTFFAPENLAYLIKGILSKSKLSPDAELGFEAHPNSTTKAHLQTLYDLGFSRLSLGIQDFDPVVQSIVNRVQSYETVKNVTELARTIGYNSINYDLIYGLPLQTSESVDDTIRKVSKLRPDRIAFYSYAHVPWVKPGQRKFTESDLPDDEAKRALYELGKLRLEEIGYKEIGMDHFALEHDDLFRSFTEGTMHRNFMGYTPQHTKLCIGLGASAISDTWTAYGQNLKIVEEYTKCVKNGSLPIFKGHILSQKELITRKHITNIMCHFNTSFTEEDLQLLDIDEITYQMEELIKDGLVNVSDHGVVVTPTGKPFVRNICMALDYKLWQHQPEQQVYSKVV